MLNEVFDLERIKLNLKSTTRSGVFGELIETIALPHSGFDHEELFEAITLRENKMPSIILPGIAIPHGYCTAIHGVIGAIGFSRAGINYDNHNREPVHLFFLLLMDEASRERHLRILAQLLELINSADFAGVREAETSQQVYDLISRY